MHYTSMVKKKGTFKYLFNYGKYAKCDILSIHYLDLKNKYNKFGICVSKKNGNSVQRNKLKRWIRAVYTLEEAKLKRGITIIITLKKTTTIENADYYKIKNDLQNGFKELNLYEKDC